MLKVKLATAIIGISSIHLLKTFINADNYSEKVLLWQTLIHVTFLLSAIVAIAHEADRSCMARTRSPAAPNARQGHLTRRAAARYWRVWPG